MAAGTAAGSIALIGDERNLEVEREDEHRTIESTGEPHEAKLRRRALWLEIATACWNVFGVDSFIEVTSAVVVGWRFFEELRGRSGEHVEGVERRASQIAGVLLLMLAVYILMYAVRGLLGLGVPAKRSLTGLTLTAISLLIMPLLAGAKLRTARVLESTSLRADAYETIACAWLSLATLCGLALNAALGWSWADPLTALVLVPLIIREGTEGLRAEGRTVEPE